MTANKAKTKSKPPARRQHFPTKSEICDPKTAAWKHWQTDIYIQPLDGSCPALSITGRLQASYDNNDVTTELSKSNYGK